MRIIDLTHPVSESMTVYPGDESVQIKTTSDLLRDGCVAHMVNISTHAGTHIDAPAHMIEDGKTLGQFPIQKFIGRGVVLDCAGKKEIDEDVISQVDIRENDIVFFHTGWNKKYYESEYFTDYPCLTEGLAQALVKRQIKMIGTDTCSPDKMPFTIHKILLGNEILIIENLTNLEKLKNQNFTVYALPLLTNLDGAQVRVVATIVD